MQLIVICQVCGTVLTQLEKDIINQDDITLYQQGCACSNCGTANIQIQVTNDS